MKLVRRILDFYLANALTFDFCIIILVWIISKYLCLVEFKLINFENQTSILSNIISTDISLAGFLLAALTIIVTFKSNLKAKGIEDSENALELIFSSKHYNYIIDVFKESIIELVICSIMLYLLWASADNLTIWTINRINVSGVIITGLTILRSLFVLNIILGLDRHAKEEKE